MHSRDPTIFLLQGPRCYRTEIANHSIQTPRVFQSIYAGKRNHMTEKPIPTYSIQRSFQELSEIEVANIERASQLAREDLRGSLAWEDILRSPRVLIVSEAGAGKTYECRSRQELLWGAGEPA